ncbi:hypothetical protein TcBrA4_0096240 [Trypanosoma cruzi]|nr:hypothetical protein TcBrA4_0096240 [Trypanosoma cruzi]
MPSRWRAAEVPGHSRSRWRKVSCASSGVCLWRLADPAVAETASWHHRTSSGECLGDGTTPLVAGLGSKDVSGSVCHTGRDSHVPCVVRLPWSASHAEPQARQHAPTMSVTKLPGALTGPARISVKRRCQI